ncbi:unnamed protein product [Acanthoscelides obtectus]|uniref:Uncharacterized protein n=1 Tax=Acanthoscelides obtectus TaxID=200917 RepID=A0A9P0Q5B7_ACAOB|nr:unnamed protein product [Acanthoscelides obtectus]CAK1635976.1 hypothetical protein AOBTE_LOCUS9666 [Acanthoscelides obtectus]
MCMCYVVLLLLLTKSQSTLGRFSKSTGRLVNSSVADNRSSQTLPRHLHKQSDSPSKLGTRSNSTINISIINTPRKLEGPAKPARTYKSNLSRSQSFNVQAGLETQRNNMYTSNPHLNKLEDSGIGLKSPGLISSLNRSHKDLNGDDIYTSRFARNGTSDYVDSKRGFLSSFREKTPEYWKPNTYSTPVRNGKGYSNGNIYEPPTRLRGQPVAQPVHCTKRQQLQYRLFLKRTTPPPEMTIQSDRASPIRPRAF